MVQESYDDVVCSMFIDLILGSAAQPGTIQHRSATAAVQILASGRASKADWDSASPARRKEIVVDDGAGWKVRVRVVEFE